MSKTFWRSHIHRSVSSLEFGNITVQIVISEKSPAPAILTVTETGVRITRRARGSAPEAAARASFEPSPSFAAYHDNVNLQKRPCHPLTTGDPATPHPSSWICL